VTVNPPTPMQIAWIFEKLLRHARRGGSLRALVHKGFGLETNKWALPVLRDAGGDELCRILNEARIHHRGAEGTEDKPEADWPIR